MTSYSLQKSSPKNLFPNLKLKVSIIGRAPRRQLFRSGNKIEEEEEEGKLLLFQSDHRGGIPLTAQKEKAFSMHKIKFSFIIPMLFPATLVYLVFFIIPSVQALYISLTNWSGFTASMKFIGVQNFVELVKDPTFWIAYRNTIEILFVGGLGVFLLAFLFTSVLSSGIKGKRFFRAVIFFPNIAAPVALGTLWGFIYNSRFGLLNGALTALGLQNWIRIWTSSELIFPSMLVAIIWIYVGFYMILLMAGVEKIPQSFFDAAKVEGANSFQTFVYVTLPMIWDVLTIALVLWGIDALKMFEFLFSMGSGAPPPTAIWTTGIYVYLLSFGKRTTIFRMGYATAVATTILISVIVLVVIVRRIMRREVAEF
jgi:ABC-type sugar transport system permease subunit